MSEFTNSQLLGKTLQQAGLISSSQIQVALVDQKYSQELRVGEIMALRGWIEQKTADFFADEWQSFIKQPEKFRIGYYFEKSGLLTNDQVCSVLKEQEKIWVKFGSVAVLQGVLEQKTVDFFLVNLFPVAAAESSLKSKNSLKTSALESDNNRVGQENSSTSIDYDDIPWID